MKPERPIGVAVLSILYWIGGVLGVLVGVLLLSVSALAPDVAIFLLLAGFGLLYVALGVLGCAVGRGLWELKTWAWWAVLILTVLSTLVGLVELAVPFYPDAPPWAPVPGLFINGVVFVYMFTPGVQEAFGIATRRATHVAHGAIAHLRCLNPSCGTGLSPEWKYCPRCLTPAGRQAVSSKTRLCANRACRRPVQRGWSHCPYCLASVAAA